MGSPHTIDASLRPSEAGAVLGLSPKTLANWRSQGTGPAYARVGDRITYRLSDLLAYRSARMVRGER
ncbi:MerR family transcriptional regulator [Corynebacterium doosanense CAU 212 = DSM 45436]|uniref:MerR family transcriptional regulator n=1 Tax=Corynebacterium doosanense CAU 212 = DSM 45436 TaxID=558173 RepID=A0A097IEB9_9CORY|nr:MerR family transcriptional regulator [Corynebacterium doosanense CAU 212 = DSM 45436]